MQGLPLSQQCTSFSPTAFRLHSMQVTRRVDGKTYALKKVDVSSLDDKELLSALNEIRLLASFAHPRIVRLYETFLGRGVVGRVVGERGRGEEEEEEDTYKAAVRRRLMPGDRAWSCGSVVYFVYSA